METSVTNRVSLWIVAVAICVLACHEDSPVGLGSGSSVALPLQEGNTWEYQRLTLDGGGSVTDSSTLVMSVASKDAFGMEVGYRLNNFLFFTIAYPPVAVLWTNKLDGIYDILGDPLAPHSPPEVHRALPFPTFPGDSLLYAGRTVSTHSVSELVTVFSGTFTSVRYDVFSGEALVGQIFIVPDLGIVKAWQQFGSSMVVDELRSYDLMMGGYGM